MSNLLKELDMAINKAVIKATDFALQKVIEKTPTDTKELISNYKINIQKVGSGYASEISNDTEHARLVEDGVGRLYNYHKGPPRNSATVFYTGDGAGMMKRTAETDEKAVADLFDKTLDNELR